MKLTRPPFILAFPGDLAGCGYHRVIRPLQIMGRNGVAAGRAETRFPDERSILAMKPDVILWQRQTEDSHIELMNRWRVLLPQAFQVFEIDDALSAVPTASWHRPYMTPNIDNKLAKAIAAVDVVTVTTDDLAEHIRSITDNKIPVRVVPNEIGRDDLEIATQTRAQAPKNPSNGKLRIGWGGGIGHSGDLAILHPMFEALKDEAEFCFLGMDPPLPKGVVKQYYGATTPDRYLPSLASLNVDLIVAPLEDNLFNRCKSNLRLIEAGACHYPVIASPVAPYHTDSPPVYAYAHTPEDWITTVRQFAELSPEARATCGEHMHNWVKTRYVMDDHPEKRLLGWLPDRARPFKPRLNSKGSGTKIVTSAAELREAFSTSEDVLYIRPGAHIGPDAQARLLNVQLDAACVLSNDGGPWGFPSQTQFSGLDPSAIEGINKSVVEFTEAVPISLSAVSGPIVLLRRSALDAVGMPDIDAFSNVEIAILDWSCAVRSRGLKIGLCPSVFAVVANPQAIQPEEMQSTAIRINARWPQGQSDDAALKSLRESLELAFHRDHYRALPPQNRGDYTVWANLCDTRGPESLAAAEAWQLMDSVPRPTVSIINYPASVPQETLDDSDWLFFVAATSKLAPDAMPLIHHAIEANPDAHMIYFDHDTIMPNGVRVAPDFKPNFDLHMLLSRDYVTQAIAVRKEAFEVIHPTVDDVDETTLFQMVLHTVNLNGRDVIAHYPRVIAHTVPANLTEAMMHVSRKLQIVNSFLEDQSWGAKAIQHPHIPLLRNVCYDDFLKQIKNPPKVSIIIPCKDNLEMLAPCIATILTHTFYPNYEIILVDNGSTRQEMLDYQETLNDPRIHRYSWPHPYNWSALNNYAVHQGTGDYLCFLNDDTRVLTPNWLTEMVGAAMIPSVGAVGARLTYPHGLVQHVGVVVEGGLSGHIHKGLPVNNPGTNAYAITSHESTAVTGACLVVSKEKYTLVGGFLEDLPHNFNDVAFCRALMARGLVNVVCTRAELQHFEGVTRNAQGLTAEAMTLLHNEGVILAKHFPQPDPYWNPNLLVSSIQNGRMIGGMDAATFNFPAKPLPWMGSDIRRVLVIGPIQTAGDEVHDGYSAYTLDCANNNASITSPPMANCGPWDIRRPDIAASFFKRLGVSKIVLSQLGESPIQLLQFLRKLNIPLEYRPVDAEAICPRGNLQPNGSSCNGGYSRGECQACMDMNSSPHGNVFMAGWLSNWLRFLSVPVRADLSHLTDPAYRDALESVFGGGNIKRAETTDTATTG